MTYSQMTNLKTSSRNMIEYWAKQNATTPDKILDYLRRVQMGKRIVEKFTLSVPAIFNAN